MLPDDGNGGSLRNYLDLVRHVLDNGRMVQTRNGNRLTAYGAQLRFDLTEGFPLVTTKKVNLWNVAGELCWFLNGDTNTAKLREWNIPIWNANADPDGNVGRAYGAMWRDWEGHLDQIARSIDLLRKAPNSTRNVVTAWNPAELDQMALPPCHFAYQVHYLGNEQIAIQMSQRSGDLLIGIPYNIASYALLAHLYAHVCDMQAVELIMDLGNVHIYEDHIPNAKIQIEREPYPLPKLFIDGHVPANLVGLHPDIFSIINYKHHPFLKYKMHA